MDQERVEEICRLIRGGSRAEELEGPDLDIKRWPLRLGQTTPAVDNRKLSRVVSEYAVCFANANGGTLLFGIQPRLTGSDAIQGCTNYDIDRMKAEIFEGTRPSITADIREFAVQEGILLAVQITASPVVHALSDGKRLPGDRQSWWLHRWHHASQHPHPRAQAPQPTSRPGV